MLDSENRPLIAKNDKTELFIRPEMINRHGMIAGATGTGKTVTLQTMAETFSAMGVPVFMSDIKGDLSGISKPGSPKGKIAERIVSLKLREAGYVNRAYPVCFWDAFGKNGHPLRIRVSDMGPVILARMLNLNDVQSALLTLIFKIADDKELLLIDFKDLRLMIRYVGENKDKFTTEYGQIASASIGAIQRALLKLENEGADVFFGEPSLDIFDLMQTDENGFGVINILAADKLMNSPLTYSMLLLWLLAELYEKMPEVGDLEKPKFVFFFDEAHMLFSNATPELLEKIEQIVRLIRSRGVGIYFVTQSPDDIPDDVSAQLGNRVQHALRAFTPKEQKAVRIAAESFRANPAFKTADVIGELAVGEGLISFLDRKGSPSIVERAYVLPPSAQVGPITPEERAALMQNSLVAGVYDKAVDRESAYEKIQAIMEADNAAAAAVAQAKEEAKQQKEAAKLAAAQEREERRQRREEERERASSLGGIATDILAGAAKSAVRSAATKQMKKLGGSFLRGLLNTLIKH